VQSAASQGATFSFTLPRSAPREPQRMRGDVQGVAAS
jgi:hypothetical protein